MSTQVFPSSFRRKPGWHLHCGEAKYGAGKATMHAAYFTHAWRTHAENFTYLETYFPVLTELRAATQFAVQALIDKAVKLIWAITAVILVVAEQCLIDTVSIIAGICGIIAFLLCSIKKEEITLNKCSKNVNQCCHYYFWAIGIHFSFQLSQT